jgi:hypothetical protein
VSVDNRSSLPVTDERWRQLQFASANDPVMQQLRNAIQQGWPDDRSEVPECVRPYFDSSDELIVIFKRHLLVVPVSKRKELLVVAHSAHIDIEGCARRMRDTLYWPRMATEVREYVSKCDICLAHRDSPGKEPTMQHEVSNRPWAKIGVDLCKEHGRNLLSSLNTTATTSKLPCSNQPLQEMSFVKRRKCTLDLECHISSVVTTDHSSHLLSL